MCAVSYTHLDVYKRQQQNIQYKKHPVTDFVTISVVKYMFSQISPAICNIMCDMLLGKNVTCKTMCFSMGKRYLTVTGDTHTSSPDCSVRHETSDFTTLCIKTKNNCWDLIRLQITLLIILLSTLVILRNVTCHYCIYQMPCLIVVINKTLQLKHFWINF